MKPIAFARGGGRLGCALFGTERAPPAQRTLWMSFLNMQSASKIFRLLNRAAFPKAPIHDLRQAAKAEQATERGIQEALHPSPRSRKVLTARQVSSKHE